MSSSETLDYKYALKCIYNAHAADVRVIAPTSIPTCGILTGSRDSTVKVWAPEGKSFKECHSFTVASTFIASLCVLPESSQYPKGLFLAGSNDCSIYGFTPDSNEPVLRLLGHSGPVCTLSFGKYGYIVSGSWDKTARVWSGQHCILTLRGHLEAVWATAIFPTQDGILTGSADHTIRLWRTGVCEKQFTGHEDCVRGLATLSDTKFLSCSNDNTVRLWVITGECLQTFDSHTDYIYSIALLNDGMNFATCGEDQTIKIWKDGICSQTVVLASKSLWSITCLQNGDLAIGTSDGKVYVLERVPVSYFERLSEENMNVAMENGKDTQIRGMSGDSLMLEASDIRSSIYNGETVVFYENQNSNMYVCQYNHTSGINVKKQPMDMKFIEKTFYKKPTEEEMPSFLSKDKNDYMFDVDVENVIYKLPFNKGENPWIVAEKFVSDHNLPVDHVGQIAEFIIKNTVSPFANEYFPATKYISYLNINVLGLRAKLVEFASEVEEADRISVADIDELVLLAHFPDVVSKNLLSSLDKLIYWKDEFLFPVLDLLRVGVKSKGLHDKISSEDFGNRLMNIFKNTKKSVNRVLIEKIFCNMFDIHSTKCVLLYFHGAIFDAVREQFSTHEKSIQKAGSALFLNFAIASHNGFDILIENFCKNAVSILNYVSDSEAVFRMLVAIGTVCARDVSAVNYFKSANIKDFILTFENADSNPKIRKVIEFLRSDLQ